MSVELKEGSVCLTACVTIIVDWMLPKVEIVMFHDAFCIFLAQENRHFRRGIRSVFTNAQKHTQRTSHEE